MDQIEIEVKKSWDQIAIEELTEEIGACTSNQELLSLIQYYKHWELINVDLCYPPSECEVRKKVIKEKIRTAECEFRVRLSYEILDCPNSSAEQILEAKRILWWNNVNKMFKVKLTPNCGEEEKNEIMRKVLSECEYPDGYYMSFEEFLSSSEKVLALD